MRKLLLLLIACAAIQLFGCTTIATHFPGVYAINVDQGNIIDQEMIDQLRPNMNKRQVLYVMGTPMLVDVFNQERWDYIYSIHPGGEDRMQKRISLYFNEDTLATVKGDFRPSRMPVARPSHETTVNVPKRVLDKTFYEKITSLFSSDDVDTVVTTAEDTQTEIEQTPDQIQEQITPEQNTPEDLQSYPLPDQESDPSTDPDNSQNSS